MTKDVADLPSSIPACDFRTLLQEVMDAREHYASCHMAEENAIRNYSGDQSNYSRKTITATARLSRADKAARAALEAAASPTAELIYCEEKKKPGGCQLHNLHCGWPECNKPPQARAERAAVPAATMFHDAGAYAQCHYCKRYSLDPKTLGDRPPKCECGEHLGWSGSFISPGPGAQWSGKTPPLAAVPASVVPAERWFDIEKTVRRDGLPGVSMVNGEIRITMEGLRALRKKGPPRGIDRHTIVGGKAVCSCCGGSFSTITAWELVHVCDGCIALAQPNSPTGDSEGER